MEENSRPEETQLNRQAEEGETESSDRQYKEHLLQHILTLACNLMIVNVLTALCALPVFTAGASFSAMSGALVRLTEGDDSGVAASFFGGFRSNFHDATMLYLFYLPVLLIDVSCIALSRTGLAVIPGFVFVILSAVSVLFLGSAVYGAILVNRYKNTAAATFRNTWILAFGYLPRTAVSVLSCAVSGGLVYLTWPWLGALALLFGLSLPGYISVKAVFPAIREQEELNAGRSGK